MLQEAHNAPDAAPSEPAAAGDTGTARRPALLDTAQLISARVAAARLAELRLRTEEHIRRSKSEATLRAYRSDMGSFALWCRAHALNSLPAEPDTVALYLTACAEAGAAISTLRRRLVSISQAHRAAGLSAPPTAAEAVRRTLSGIARTRDERPRRVAPLRTATLRAMLEATPEDDLLAVRDHALLLLGFAGGFRRSELAGLRVEDLAFVEEGVDVLIRRSKTDQEGEGRTIGIPRGRHPETCPVLALQRWLRLSEISSGPLWLGVSPNGRPGTLRRNPAGRLGTRPLSPQAIARVVQRAAARAGLEAREFAGHSLRAGFATEAAAQGASERAIMAQTGHRSVVMVRRYIREGERYRENAAAVLGL